MAQEITATGFLQFAKGNVSAIARTKSLAKFDVAGVRYVSGVQQIGLSAEALALGEITAPGWYFFLNLGTVNFVMFREGAAGADFLKLKPGEFSIGRLAGTAPHAIADTAAVLVEYLMVED